MTEYIPLVKKGEENEEENFFENEDGTVLYVNEDIKDSSQSLKDYVRPKKDNSLISNLICCLVLIICYIIWIILYKKSLTGGDLYWVAENLNKLLSYMIGAFICFSLNLWIIAFMKIPKRHKFILYVWMISSFIGYFFYDHGEMFDFHGMYNFIIFTSFIIIFDGLGAVFYFWYKVAGGKKFITQLSLFLLIFGTVESIILNHFKDIWDKGFFDKRIEDREDICKIKIPLPWFDLLPRGTQNMWTGSQSCKRKELFDAYFDPSQDNKLVVKGCTADKIIYKIIPDTRYFTYGEKLKDIVNHSVYNKMEADAHVYTEPVELDDVEAVYVLCGDQQNKLVTRIAGRRVEPEKEEQPIEKLNVLVMYFDAVSRRQFFRNLPHTAKKLESLHKTGITHLNQFFRYGIVGFNTVRNSLALFTGVQYNNVSMGIPIWERYRDKGYVAGVADDLCEDWDTTYNYRTAFSLDHELLAPFCLPEYYAIDGCAYGNFKGPFSVRRRCITGQYVHNFALNYTRDFINLYDGTNPWFFRSSYIEGHESSSEVLGLMDDDLVKFFDSISEETLNRTAIFIMSDHGLHMGYTYLFTEHGSTEHKLPMLTTLIPESFLDKYPELRKNLDDNEQKLINAFDIHATLSDLLEFDIDKEPLEKFGGIDISKAKLNNAKLDKRSEEQWDEEKEYFKVNKRKNSGKGKTLEREKSHINPGTIVRNGTVVWGKSLLRDVPIRNCEQSLIYPVHCVCH